MDGLKHVRQPSLEELDAFLDEIEETEKKEEELRNSKTKIKIPSSVINEQNEDLIVWIRSIWRVGSKVEVYSSSEDNWLKGTYIECNIDVNYINCYIP